MLKKSKPAKRRSQRGRSQRGRPQDGGRAQIGGSPQGPIYKQKPPMERGVHAASTTTLPTTLKRPKVRAPNTDFVQSTPVPSTHFVLHEDGSIGTPVSDPARSQAKLHRAGPEDGAPIRLVFSSDAPFIRLYHGNCLELLDAIAAKYPEGRFDAIFADPPYFLSNGGITCHFGKL